MRVFAIECKAGRECAAQSAKALQRALLALIAADVESPISRDSDLDLISLFQLQGIDYGRRKTNRQAVTPTCDLHMSPPRWIYIEQT
jgi:hypothetical protein